METDTPEQAVTEHSTVLGVDLGVNQLAVTSTGVFWSGHEFDHWRREYRKRRASLQRCGSRHAHENIQAVGRKETGRFTMMLHRIGNGIIAEAAESGCTVIAFEELTGSVTDCPVRRGATSGPSSDCTSTSNTRPSHSVSPLSR